eukprot:scaffold653_cov345-Pavlova_lutheri.AAC.10
MASSRRERHRNESTWERGTSSRNGLDRVGERNNGPAAARNTGTPAIIRERTRAPPSLLARPRKRNATEGEGEGWGCVLSPLDRLPAHQIPSPSRTRTSSDPRPRPHAWVQAPGCVGGTILQCPWEGGHVLAQLATERFLDHPSWPENVQAAASRRFKRSACKSRRRCGAQCTVPT